MIWFNGSEQTSSTLTRYWPMNEDACYAEQMNKAARKMYIIYFWFLVKHSIHEKAHQKPCKSVQISLCVFVYSDACTGKW